MQTLFQDAKALSSLAFPIVLGMSASVLIALVDTLMLAPLGKLPLAAAGLTTGLVLIWYSGIYGYISMINVRMAEAHGAQDRSQLNQVTCSGMAAALLTGCIGAASMAAVYFLLPWLDQPDEVLDIIGPYWFGIAFSLIPFSVFYTLKGFFDSIERPWIGLWVGVIALTANIPLNYLFIHMLGYGLFGAALGTLCAYAAGLGFALTWLWRRDYLSGSIVGPEVALYLRLGTPVGIGFVGEGAAFAFIGLAMGWFGATALAAHQIINSFGSVIYMVPLGISIAVSVLCGQRVGRGDLAGARAMGLTAVGVSMSWMVLCTALVILASEWIAHGLSPTAEVAGLVASLLIINAVMQIGDGIQSAALGGLRGQSDTLYPTAVTLACYGLVGVPLALVLGFSFGWGPHGLWIGYGTGLFLAGGILTRRLWVRPTGQLQTNSH